jgi:hypothetical protein
MSPRILAAGLLILAVSEPLPAQSESYPHLTPRGFGMHVAGGGKVSYAPWDYRPREVPGATSHLQLPFLGEGRVGERIDIWVPADVKPGERLPCIVMFYGGGWGGKVAGGMHCHVADLIARRYVVALPDYLLCADEPVPAAIWDGARAIRWLRASAEAHHIDPARMGVWGFSAGGWLVQFLAPSDPTTVYEVPVKQGIRSLPGFAAPMLEPQPPHADQPLRVQAVVSDWGCGRLTEKRMHARNPAWFGPDDPPLLTCHNVKDQVPDGPAAYRAAGATVGICHPDVRNTHVPDGATPAVSKGGSPTTWHGRIYEFFDEHVKNPKRATAPEAGPAGPAGVVLRSVHGDAAIRFTTDGSEPTASSPAYSGPVTLRPGETLRAIAVVPGLQPSAPARFPFGAASSAGPVITMRQAHYTATVGRPFDARFEAEGAGVEWHLCGRRGNVIDTASKGRKAWLIIDPKTGRLSGTPEAPGYVVAMVVANGPDGKSADARRVVVTIEEAPPAK